MWVKFFNIHPRRPRGSQSGREKRCTNVFKYRRKSPVSYRSISKNSSGCWLLIGHKKCLVLLCPICEQFLLSSFRVSTRHSRPQSPSFLGHVVGKRGALEAAVTGCQKISDIRSHVQKLQISLLMLITGFCPSLLHWGKNFTS